MIVIVVVTEIPTIPMCSQPSYELNIWEIKNNLIIFASSLKWIDKLWGEY